MNAKNDGKKGRKEETDRNRIKREWKTNSEELNKRQSTVGGKIEIKRKESIKPNESQGWQRKVRHRKDKTERRQDAHKKSRKA